MWLYLLTQLPNWWGLLETVQVVYCAKNCAGAFKSVIGIHSDVEEYKSCGIVGLSRVLNCPVCRVSLGMRDGTALLPNEI